ncbi:RNA-binding signal recognition particle subunit srp14 [Orobanche hederae]
MVRLQPDPFLNELTNMFERTTEKGSVWVTLKHSSDKSKVKSNKMKTAGEKIEFKCLVRATDGKKNIATMIGLMPVGPKDHQRFQSSYATILKARMTSLKKRERKDKRKAADSEKKQDSKKKPSAAAPLPKSKD